jgi:hypothetical protein
MSNQQQASDGGPAFPRQFRRWDNDYGEWKPCEPEEGMTLRDYFAAKALQGFLANKDRPAHFHPNDDATYCYAVADAMLKARSA